VSWTATEAAAALAGFADPECDPVTAFSTLFHHIRPASGRDAGDSAARYAAVVSLLEHDRHRAGEVRRQVLKLLARRRLVGFFADSGILPDTGFFTEAARIVGERLLPSGLLAVIACAEGDVVDDAGAEFSGGVVGLGEHIHVLPQRAPIGEIGGRLYCVTGSDVAGNGGGPATGITTNEVFVPE
jgi:hypothetical protein